MVPDSDKSGSTLLREENPGIKNNEGLVKELRKNSTAFRDSVIILISTIFMVIAALYYNMFEMFTKWSRAHENWNIDELIIVLAFLAFAFNIFSLRRWYELRFEIIRRIRVEEEIKHQLHEKEILIKEVHHRIKNNIGSIKSLLGLHADGTSNPDAKIIINDAINRVESMYQLYNKLLPVEDYIELSVKNYLEDLVKSVIDIFSEKGKISIEMEIEDFKINVKKLFSLGAIINELITNSIKYAFINRESGAVVIKLKKQNNDGTLSVHDNGCGLPDNFDINKSTGFGLILVKLLSQQLKGKISMENNNGTTCTVTFVI